MGCARSNRTEARGEAEGRCGAEVTRNGNAGSLALAHRRLGHPEEARRWLDRAERWLSALDRTYAADRPGVLTGQPQAQLSFEFWVYAQLLRREAAGPILDAAFPADPFAG
jgi:hypothetical protein